MIQKDIPYPPEEMRDLIGSANQFWFSAIAYEFATHFINLCGLQGCSATIKNPHDDN
jgi:hypothetical protein